MEQSILQIMEKYAITPANKIVVGVSTGVDSMVLLSILEHLFSPSQIIVAHINHQKRKASLEEEAFIRTYCQNKNITLEVKQLDKQLKNANFQEMARNFRIDFFLEVMKKHQAPFLFLAHHLDDDVETFFMRLLRGSSLRSLVGMKDAIKLDQGLLLRPFLTIKKQTIKEFANTNLITYYEDESNQQNMYTRNRIRNQIIPLVIKENPAFLEQFSSFKQDVLQIADWMDQIRDQWIEVFVQPEQDGICFSKQAFLKNKSLFQQEILFSLLHDQQPSKSTIEEIRNLIASDEANLKTKWSKFTFLKEYDQIRFLFNEQTSKCFCITLDGVGEYPIDEKRKIIIRKNNHKSSANPSIIWYNSDKLPITARCRQTGDKMHFEYGTKKVKKILIDRKIPLSKREQVVVLEKDGEIIALLGLVVSSKWQAEAKSDILIELKEI